MENFDFDFEDAGHRLPALLASAALLQSEPAPQLQRAVVEAKTLRQTSFFRDAAMFSVLQETILPRLIAANAAERRLRIWSAACSTGQEAYSMAMLLCERFPQLESWDVSITGTDISPEVIAHATRARYRRPEVNRGLPARMLVKSLVRDGNEWEMTPPARRLCAFQCADLRAPMPGLPLFDLVLLRDVLLYLPQDARNSVFRAVHRQMRPDGYLALGASEQAEDSTNLFRAEPAGDYCYYRPARAR